MLDSEIHVSREGEAPAEPQVRENVVPDSRLSRSFALPLGGHAFLERLYGAVDYDRKNGINSVLLQESTKPRSTCPCTSVNRRFAPLCRNVSLS